MLLDEAHSQGQTRRYFKRPTPGRTLDQVKLSLLRAGFVSSSGELPSAPEIDMLPIHWNTSVQCRNTYLVSISVFIAHCKLHDKSVSKGVNNQGGDVKMLILVLKDSLRTKFKSLSLSLQVYVGPCPCPGPCRLGPCPCPCRSSP